jgi:nitrogenase molybdenum-cofactor synthesis protein NifE
MENEHQRKKSDAKVQLICQQPIEPGVVQGNCAFNGVMISLGLITDAVHLVHGAIACTHNPGETHGSLSLGAKLSQLGCSTDFNENNIIFGGEKKLHKAIEKIFKSYHPAAIFVYATCSTALIGDDIESVCKIATKEIGMPVIPVNSAGFLGSKNLGKYLANETLLKYVIGTAEPAFTTPFDINIIGEYNVAAELWHVLPLFKRLGIHVLSKIIGDTHYHELCYAHRAKLNVVIGGNVALQMAEAMQAKYDIPYITESFYGGENVNSCLRNIALALGDRYLQERTEWLISEENTALEIALSSYRSQLQGKRILVSMSGEKSWFFISAAKNLGMQVIATFDIDNSEIDKTQTHQLIGEENIILTHPSPQRLLQIIKEKDADILVAEVGNQHTAIKAKIPLLDIHQHHTYTGYAGLLEMTRKLTQALSNPVWQQVTKPAPWDE